jgi:hypothetical protein
VVLGDSVLPAVAAALGEDVEADLLYELDHLQFILHPAPAGEYPLHALLGGEEFQGSLADAAVLLLVGEEEHEAVEGGHAVAELPHVPHLVFAQLVQQPQLPEVVHQQRLEVNVQLHRVVLPSPKHLPVPLHRLLLKHHRGGLGSGRQGLPGWLLGDLVRQLQRRFQFFILVEGELVEVGHVLVIDKFLHAKIFL